MKICRFNDDRIGLVRGEVVFDITDIAIGVGISAPQRPDGDPLVSHLPALAARAKGDLHGAASIPLRDVYLETPVRFPTKIIGAGSNYPNHKREMSKVRDPAVKGYDLYGDGVFLKANSSLSGPADPIRIRFPERQTQHEVELVIVIGRTCADVPPERALEVVAGYCLGLDITMRGKEERSLRKSFDTYSVLGPWITTADEVGDPGSVDIALDVNGAERQSDLVSSMIVDSAAIVSFASRFYTLDRKSTRLNSSHTDISRMPSSA